MSVQALRTALTQRFPAAVRPLAPAPAPALPDPRPAPFTIPLGAVTEVLEHWVNAAPRGSGGCTLVLRRMAELLAAHPEHYAAFVGGSIDPRHPGAPIRQGRLYPPAAARLGVPLDRLLLIQCNAQVSVLRVIELLLRGGATRLVALDVPPDTAPLRLSTYHRLRRCTRDAGAALVFLAEASVIPADHRIVLSQPRAV